jgi:3-oxoacyl-[acyl-carrier-protein] synthase III
MSIGVSGTGSHLPPRVVTNRDLEQMLDTTDDWITSRTGIRTRRWAAEGTASSDLGTLAARQAMAAAGVGPDQVDGLLVATSSPDRPQPATACAIQANLGLSTVPAFDVAAVCSGFVYALTTCAGLMRGFPQYRRMLVVGCEVYSRIIDLQDRTSSVFFGDGAGAVLLEQLPEGYGLLGAHLMADGTQADVVQVPAGGSREPISGHCLAERRQYFRMDGRRVWEFATSTLPGVVKEALSNADLAINDVDLLVMHQANARMIESVSAAMGVPEDRVPLTVDRYGNTAAASVPITLDEAVRAGRLRRGDVVVLAAVGGGMTAGAAVLRWY